METSSTLKTTLLLGGLTGLFMLIGSVLGGTGGMLIAFVLAIALNMGAWWFSDSIALRMSGAKEATAEEMPELHRMVERLATNASLPKPRVYVIETEMPNAFATGRSQEKAAVAVTTGIMSLLNRAELEGVVAHELAHIRNRDTLISSVAATIGGAITMIADMAMWSMLFGGFGGSDEEEGSGGGVFGGILMLVLAPIASLIIQMAISRSREFAADESGARILGTPLPLAGALEKLDAWSQSRMQTPVMASRPVNPATSHLYIVPPTVGGLAELFRTHPRTEERVRRLRAMASQTERVYA